MVCIYCGSDTQVTNSRHRKRTNSIWRRRHCSACGAIFTSIEQADLSYSVTLQSETKHLEPFSRDKLLTSIYDACKHRKDAISASSALTDTVIQQLLPTITSATVNRGDVVTITKRVLARFDRTAATLYTAHHPFKSLR